MIVRPGQRYDEDNLETSGGNVDLKRIKQELLDVQAGSSNYFRTLSCAYDWWNSRWDGQTVDGRKWYKVDGQDQVFPWPGASDTRVRLTKSVLNEYRTICLYALQNMKLQAQSTRPFANPKESSQATTLINWQIFTHMLEEWGRETELACIWAGAHGASVVSVDWEQERRLEHVDLNTMQFGDWLGQIMGQQFQPTEVQDILDDTSNDEDLIAVIQETSEVVTKAGARKILRDLRDLRTATIPVPYVFRNKPRLTALRPMVDVFFREDADDLQRERWIDRVEYVTEAVLEDRIETDGYDPGFVKEAVKRKGVYSVATHAANSFLNNNWNSYGGSLNSIRTGSPSYEDDSGLIEIHHFRHYSLDMGVPCLYRTVFHMELEEYATHGIDEYKHGQMPFHALRFERDQRPIMSSQGIPSITYTWENEEKAQLDARTDRTSIAMAPPMFVGHSQVTLIKQAYIPHGTIPTLPGREVKFAPIPPYDPGSIEISRSIRQRTSEYFGWFGPDVDPQLKQMRVMELVDRVMGWFKPVVNQMLMLDYQFLTDEEVTAVVGKLARPFSQNRQQIQDQNDLTMTCDPRDLDLNFIKETAGLIGSILPWDQAGTINRTPILTRMLEKIDYTLADQAIQSPESVTGKEIEDEMAKVSAIIGSGVEQVMPHKGANFNLRLQTMTNLLKSTPFISRRVQQQPDVLKALENRYLYLTRQIQQDRNASIGRDQVGSAFDHLQPVQIDSGSEQ